MLVAGVDVLAGRLAAGAIAMPRIVLTQEFLCKERERGGKKEKKRRIIIGYSLVTPR